MAIIYIDRRYTYDYFFDLASEYWIIYVISLLIPIINILATAIYLVVYVFIFIANLIDDCDGDKVIKKIFFIKDGK